MANRKRKHGVFAVNRDVVVLSSSKEERMLKLLIRLNRGIRAHFGTDNHHIFITQNGSPMNSSKSSNCAISKPTTQICKAVRFREHNAHVIRRIREEST